MKAVKNHIVFFFALLVFLTSLRTYAPELKPTLFSFDDAQNETIRILPVSDYWNFEFINDSKERVAAGNESRSQLPISSLAVCGIYTKKVKLTIPVGRQYLLLNTRAASIANIFLCFTLFPFHVFI